MTRKKILLIFFLFTFLVLIIFYIYQKFNNKVEKIINKNNISDEIIYNANIINNVNYTTKDANGNEYIITALKGQIDLDKPNILYLTDVKAIIKLANSENINIKSDYGKYNSDNFDTIFSKNVLINYLNNIINGEYLDFSLDRNSMIVSRKVVYTNLDNILEADVVDINLKTKDTKIFMYDKNEKVNIRSKN
tara:strand:+ start:312 stop:887 length:576 start_codon:yes stop_codon:yes gene_type:complete